MIKRSVAWLCVLANLLLASPAMAKTVECLVKPSYDIVVSQSSVQLANPQTNVIIMPNGAVMLNGQSVKTKPAIQKEAKQFQAYLREQLPLFENRAYWQLNDVRVAFETAIREKLGNKSELLKHLNNLHAQLTDLLHKSIQTKDGVTYFYYQPFNNIKKDGEDIGEKVFYKILGDSITSFNLFKNYSAIKKIAKQEWKEQKVILKSFDEHVCELISDIDNQYNHLMIGLN
ncbi:hypothetical protein GCM10023211_04800 [Orbus sasakiae]|uniref:DUF2884 family protein n=1 Tax=Orbus sasakiae TaxID=1078475 RepID=A0ABP9N261_9GAMM